MNTPQLASLQKRAKREVFWKGHKRIMWGRARWAKHYWRTTNASLRMKNMDYETAKVEKERLEAIADQASKKLQTFPRGPMGLTLDSVKATDEWKQARLAFDRANTQAREFNKGFVRIYKKRWSDECHAKRFQKQSLQ